MIGLNVWMMDGWIDGRTDGVNIDKETRRVLYHLLCTKLYSHNTVPIMSELVSGCHKTRTYYSIHIS